MTSHFRKKIWTKSSYLTRHLNEQMQLKVNRVRASESLHVLSICGSVWVTVAAAAAYAAGAGGTAGIDNGIGDTRLLVLLITAG